jgi:hypothetical protein
MVDCRHAAAHIADLTFINRNMLRLRGPALPAFYEVAMGHSVVDMYWFEQVRNPHLPVLGYQRDCILIF